MAPVPLLGVPGSHPLPGPRGFELPAPLAQRASGPRPSLQILDACGLREGRGLVPGDRQQSPTP